MSPRTKHALGLTLAFLISGVCLYFFLAGLDGPKVWAALKQARFAWMIPSALAIWLSMVARAIRWRILLEDQKVISPVRLYHMEMIGITTSGIMPGRLGEVARAIFLAAKEKLRFLGVFSTVFVERFLDLGFVIALTVCMLLAFPFPDNSVRDTMQGFGVGFALGFVAFATLAAALTFVPHRVVAITRRVGGFVSENLGDRLAALVESFAGGLRVFRDLKRTLWASFWTLVVWTGIVLSEYFLFLAFEIDAGLLAAGLLTAALALAVAAPQAPGFIGVFQIATTMVLVHCFTVEKDVADAYAIVLWVIQMLFLIALGLISFAIEGLSFSDIRSAKAQAEEAA